MKYYILRNEAGNIESLSADPAVNEALQGELAAIEAAIVVKRKELAAAADEAEKEKKDKELKDLLKDHKAKEKEIEAFVKDQEALPEDDPEILAFLQSKEEQSGYSSLIAVRIAKNNYEAAVLELKAEGALPADYPESYPESE